MVTSDKNISLVSTTPSNNFSADTFPNSNYTTHLLSKAHPTNSDLAQQIYTDKIKNRPLHLLGGSSGGDPTFSTTVDARTARQKARIERLKKQKSRKPKPLTAKEKRKLRIYEIPKDGGVDGKMRKYNTYIPLHVLWVGYMRELLFGNGEVVKKGSNNNNMGVEMASKLMSADFHGAKMRVVRSKCPSRVGIEGIVVKETKMTWEIVTKENKIKVVPKEHGIFEVGIPLPGVEVESEHTGRNENIKEKSGDAEERLSSPSPGKRKNEGILAFQIHGSNFCFRAAERGSRKFKAKPTWDL